MAKIKRGFRIQLYPNKTQQHQIAASFGCSRWLWNHMLAMQIDRHDNESSASYLSAFPMNYILKRLKQEYPWLKGADSTALTGVNENLHAAYTRFFKGQTRFPRFKSKKHEQSYISKCVNNNISIVDSHHIRIPKLGSVYFKAGKLPHGRICSITIRQKASGKYEASVLCEYEEVDLPKTKKTIGIDVGLKDFAILSDGAKIGLPRFDKRSEKQLRYWQRIASRRLLSAKAEMKKNKDLRLTDFRNYQKARQMCAKIHEHIANQRKDYLDKLSTWLVKTYDVIVIEDLKAKGMMHNHHLARAIANASWNMFANMLSYKCLSYGKKLIRIDPKYTSQTCSVCGCVNNRLGYNAYGWLKVREWDCSACGSHHDRDINAAINIKEKGLAVGLV